MTDRLSREAYVRAALATEGQSSFEPVHVQKLFFLLDDRVMADAPYFAFEAYDYGPFDRGVYDALHNLSLTHDVQVDCDWRGMRMYSLTPEGLAKGLRDLGDFPRVSRMRSLSTRHGFVV